MKINKTICGSKLLLAETPNTVEVTCTLESHEDGIHCGNVEWPELHGASIIIVHWKNQEQ